MAILQVLFSLFNYHQAITDMSKLECVEGNGKKYATEIPYSTTERRVGTWTNGKPLYRKVIQTTTPTVPTNGTVVWRQVMIENVSFGRLVSADYETNSNNGKSFGSILSYMRTSPYFIRSYFTVNMNNHKGILEIRSDDTTFNNLNVIAIVEYTKTTD